MGNIIFDKLMRLTLKQLVYSYEKIIIEKESNYFSVKIDGSNSIKFKLSSM